MKRNMLVLLCLNVYLMAFLAYKQLQVMRSYNVPNAGVHMFPVSAEACFQERHIPYVLIEPFVVTGDQHLAKAVACE